MDQSASLIYQVKELHKSVSPEQLEIIPDQYYFIQSYKVIFDTYLVTQSSYSHNETNVFLDRNVFPLHISDSNNTSWLATPLELGAVVMALVESGYSVQF